MASRPPPSRASSLARVGSSSSIRQRNDELPSIVSRADGKDGPGEELEDQMANFVDMKQAVDDMTNVFTTLQKQCSALKARHHVLENDYMTRSLDLEALNAQIQDLITKRDGLQTSLSPNGAACQQWWGTSTPSSSTTPPPIPEGDVAGRLNRKVWMLEEQVKSLKQENEHSERIHLQELEGEIAVSAGLRDRIGNLEGKRSALRLEKESLENKVKELQTSLKSSDQAKANAEERHKREKEGWTDILNMTRDKLAATTEEVASVKREKENVDAELRRANEEAQLARAMKSPPRVLQNREVNIPLSQSSPPITPTKPKLKGYPTLLPSPSTRTSPSHDVQRQLARLEASYTHLFQTHQSLKSAYDELRDIHKKDIEHMKEYRKAQLAREEERKRRKDEKKARALSEGRSVPASTSASADLPRSTSAANNQEAGEGLTSSGDTVRADEGGLVEDILVEESESLPKLARQSIPHSGAANPRRKDEAQDRYDDIGNDKALGTTLSKQTSRRRPSESEQPDNVYPAHSNISTPILRPTERKRALVQSAHVTPWLGGSDRTNTTSSARRLAASRSRDLDLARDEEIFASPPEMTSTPTVSHTPLVRDRGVAGDATSLRKMVMQKTVPHEVETPRRASAPSSQREDLNLSGSPGPSTRTPAAMKIADTASSSSSTKKRRVTDIDMDGLTPDQKAIKRKLLAKMPASERRELYKDYKGKGRYVRPEEVQTSVREEYEIDPEQNEGAAFAFHDVKRKRAERRQMHGGDCECCKDYYEAVGELPRFNHGPVWRDEPVSADEGDRRAEDAVREHQNRVSRHRETWTKPPTPPGYWKIGFPSTQDVLEQNEKADQMIAEKEAKLRRETTARNSKWRKKA
ncbi:hypothetical protein IAU59_007286 [Kwoniella sp. CBS 9459]